MAYRWILFDADNTLFDFDRSAAAALRQAFSTVGHAWADGDFAVYEEINRRYWQAFERGEIERGVLRTARFRELLDRVGLPAVDAGEFSRAYEARLGEQRHLLPGAAEIVEQLARHVSLVLMTNGLRAVQRPRFAAAPIVRHFQDVLISEEIGAAKPAPEMFAAAFERMGHPEREAVLIVGDSLSSDIQGGSDYGIDTCWFNPGAAPLDREVRVTHEIRELRELPTVCVGG